MKYHRYYNKKHTKCYCDDEYCVQLTKERQCGHMVDGPYPQRGKYILKSEDTAKQKSEYSGENTRRCDDSRQGSLLKVVDKRPANEEQQPLTYISEHNSEDERIGNAYEYGRIHLVM